MPSSSRETWCSRGNLLGSDKFHTQLVVERMLAIGAGGLDVAEAWRWRIFKYA